MVQESDPLKNFDSPAKEFGRLKDTASTSTYEDTSSPGGHRTPEEIRADMRRTRAEIDQTVDGLQDQLRPSAIASRVASSAQHVAGGIALRALNAIKDNPLPATVIGAGLLMMLTRRQGSDPANRWPSGREATIRPEAVYRGPSTFERARDAVGHTLSSAKEKVSDLSQGTAEKVKGATGAISEKLHDASRTVREVSSTTAEKASRFGHQVSDGAKHSVQWVDEMVHEYPLAAGAACFALGIAGGFALPASRKENELVGPARDRLMKQARVAGAELIQKGEEVAERAVEVASTAVKEKADAVSQSAASSSASDAGRSSTTPPSTPTPPKRWNDTPKG